MALRSPERILTDEAACETCGEPTLVTDRLRDYSTTRGPMAEHVVVRCSSCGHLDLLHVAAQTAS